MLENIKNATQYAFSDNVADMATEIQSAIQHKIYDALQSKKVEVAQSFMNPVTESKKEPFDDFDDEWKDNSEVKNAESELRKMKIKLPNVQHKEVKISKASGELKGNQQKLDKNKNGKLDSQDFKMLRKESYIEEKLDPSMGVKKYIDDFIKSDNPKFEGKSKKERIQMALGAFYDAKKQKNEELEDIQELNKDTLNRYINKAGISKNDNRDAAKSAEAAAFKMKDDRIGDWKSMKSQEDSHNRTVKNREKGIKRAAKKLTKNEEVEKY